MEKGARENFSDQEVRTLGDAFASPGLQTTERLSHESQASRATTDSVDAARTGLTCPNCGAALEGRK